MEMTPTFREFVKLSKKHNFIVFSHKFYSDWLTPPSVYYGLRKSYKGESFLLESVEGQEKVCHFSFLGFMPLCTFKTKGKKIYIRGKEPINFETKRDPLFELKKIMSRFNLASRKKLRFLGGFVGYFGYDMVRFYEDVGKDLPDPVNAYDSYFILPKFLIVFDHLRRQIEIFSFLFLEEKKYLKEIYFREKETLQRIYEKAIVPHKLPALSFSLTNVKVGSCENPFSDEVESNFKKKDFLTAVRRAKKYIEEGEIIQTVLSQRFSLNYKADPFTAYRYLRILNPSPYMFYLNFKDVKLCGSSPEMLIRCENKELTTRPIAGTRKRGRNDFEDSQLQDSLLNDPKEKAEHIMLLDLARNDLGHVAKAASVTVPIFMTIEKFSHVMHIVSEVRAKIKESENIFSALVSCFPAGTVSGAPKVRAMQIINELEPEARGVYAGCVGYFSFTKSLDTCIIIRTIVFKNNKAYVQAGAGIVSDSKPLNEYKETINKAKAVILSIRLAGR